eukprot:CAMPEP_0180415930 /NCGR_PEP_ID=MMETSP1036_2-20121128/193_1 /TAXON_ID=632150 /ORGANISM="Azadinium spinosum, Strain 3D9" /LENGTH=79 /DNA_ID=CAMNT_0022420787 /DNA_START=536 /DNA_END=775 /DNA_ORIENTATION=+
MASGSWLLFETMLKVTVSPTQKSPISSQELKTSFSNPPLASGWSVLLMYPDESGNLFKTTPEYLGGGGWLKISSTGTHM